MLSEQAAHDALTLNADHQQVYDAVRSRVDSENSPTLANVDYVDVSAGTGKTFLYAKLLHYVRMTGRIALAVAMFGIAALLLLGGRTAHSRFRLPVQVPLEGCKANIKAQSIQAQLLRDAALLL